MTTLVLIPGPASDAFVWRTLTDATGLPSHHEIEVALGLQVPMELFFGRPENWPVKTGPGLCRG